MVTQRFTIRRLGNVACFGVEAIVEIAKAKRVFTVLLRLSCALASDPRR